MLNIGWWGSLPRAEASSTLGNVPSVLHATIYLSPVRPPLNHLWFFYHIIPSPLSAPTLLSIYLQLLLPCPHPPPPLLQFPPLSLIYPGWAAPTISGIGTFPAIALPPDTSP